MKLWYRLTRLLLAAILLSTLGLALVASLPSQTSLAAVPPGSLYTWGANNSGQLGDGTTTTRNTPGPANLPNGAKPTTIAAGGYHALAIGSDGNLYTWGQNNYGQLGDGSNTNRNTPQLINLPNGAKPTAIAGGGFYSLAIGSDGNLYTWGRNDYGQLGNNSTTDSNTPGLINLPNGVKPTALAAGYYHSLAIGNDGNLYAWGRDDLGQLGDGTATTTATPHLVNLPNGAKPTAIAAGGDHNLAIGSDGNLYAWGDNQAGQLGDGTTTIRYTPQPINLPNGVKPTTISVGSYHNLAIGNDGNLYSWGYNAYGQVGDGTTTTRYTPGPANLPNGVKPTAIAAGGFHNLAIGNDNKLYTWGLNTAGQLGDGSYTQRNTPQPINIVTPTAIAAGIYHNLAIVTPPNLSIDDVSLNEGNAGTTSFTFTVSLNSLSSQPVTFDIATQDGTATAASGDYTAKSLTTQTIPAGSTSYTFTVLVNGDTAYEPNETFSVVITNLIGANPIKTTGTGTIINDDPIPTVSINNVSLAEGNAGQTAFNFTVSLSNPSSQPVSLDFATADGTATVADSDYQGQFGPLTIPAGQTTATITVNVNGDTKLEPDETFTVTLSNPVNATLGAATGTGTILNDDTAPTISIGNVSQAEGNTGTTAFNFPVTLSNPTSQAVTVNYATADGTATTADSDYAAATGTLTIPAGQSTGTITVNVNGDTKTEPNETFTVALSNPTGAKLGTPSTGTGTIVNDDGVPALSIAGVTQAEGNAGQTAFNFTVSLSNASSQPVTVNYATGDGTATLADNDYAAATGTLTIPAGQTTGTITVNVNGDTKFEANETFTVALSSPTGATLGTASTGTGTITNDDGAPAVSIGDVSQAEGNSGTTAFNFPVTLSAASGQPVVVQYTTADGTATLADSDYAAATGTLTIPAGQTTGTITVNVNGDTKVEPNETFTVNLSNPTGATLDKTTGTGTIVNDDSPPPPTIPAVSVADVRQREGNSGTTAFNFTVRLSVAAAGPVTVNYATLDDTATVADKDYLPTSGTLTFAPGETAKTVTVLVNGDTKIEPDEVFFLVLTNPTGANLGKGTAQGIILNDDGEVDEADLVGKLRVTPDREFDLDGNGLLTYVLTVKNIGLGASSAPAVQLPIDSDFEVAYATFTTDSVSGAFYEKTVTDPVTAVLPYAVLPYAQLRLPVLAPGQAVTATVTLRAVAGAKPGELNTRFAIVWDNLDGKPHHYYSNRVHVHLGKGTTRNETDGLVQFLGLVAAGNGLDEQGRATVQLGGDIYAPGERVYLWYTDGNGKSTGLGYVWADLHTGELNTQLVIPGWQSGQRYFLAALGDRSGVIGSATVLVQSRATTQSLTENESATTGGYNYAEVAPLFDNTALQTVLKGLTAEQ